MPHHNSHETVDVWSVEGRFAHYLYSPKGGIEGMLIETDGIPAQFVFERHGEGLPAQLADIRAGQALVVEGTESPPSPKGEAAHTVYRFERLAAIDGKPLPEAQPDDSVDGRVARIHYARHGEANGVVLDNGDFVHTRPQGFAQLNLKVGDRVQAEGRVRPLATGEGRVVEAARVNDIELE